MSLFIGSFHAILVVLVLSGIEKLVRPNEAASALESAGLTPRAAFAKPMSRLLGLAEVALAVAGALLLSLPVAVAIASLFVGFVWFGRRLASMDPAAGCGCFGSQPAPPGPVHRNYNLAAIAVLGSVAVALASGRSLPAAQLVDDGPGTWLPYLAAVLLAAILFLMGPSLVASLSPPAKDGHQVSTFSVSGSVTG